MALRRAALALSAACVIGLSFAVPTQAASLPLLGACQAGTDQVDALSYRFCSGFVPSFDGLPLDVDLTLPAGTTPAGGERPVLCHPVAAGSCGYNNLSFAARGFAVLNYTARGFHGSCGPGSPNAASPACAAGWTHLADMRYEVHDTQFLAGLLVDAGVAHPGIAVTGESYGGGQSWLLAVLANRVMNPDGSLSPWKSPHGVPLHVAAAVPKYPWTDLVDALMPNGRASDGLTASNGNRTFPYGIKKESFVDYLNSSGAQSARYAAPGQDPTADLTTWYAEISAGETPAQSTYAPGIINQIAGYRSAYYQGALIASDVAARTETPIFDVQGWTDGLFPAVQGASMVEKIRAADLSWPAYLYESDLGHPAADDNKLAEWQVINRQIASFIGLHLGRSGANPPANYQQQLTTCDASGGAVYRSAALGSPSPARASFTSAAPLHATASAPTDSAAGSATDPIAFYARNGSKGGCITLPAALPANGAMTSWTFPVCSTMKMLGAPALLVSATVAGTDAEVDSRLWDVAADGSVTLVSRGMYRWTGSPGAASITYAMLGNGWVFPGGHSLRLEITQNDAPYVRLDNYASAITYASVRLVLPVTSAATSC